MRATGAPPVAGNSGRRVPGAGLAGDPAGVAPVPAVSAPDATTVSAKGYTPLVNRNAQKPLLPSAYQISPRSGTNAGADMA